MLAPQYQEGFIYALIQLQEERSRSMPVARVAQAPTQELQVSKHIEEIFLWACLVVD